MELLNRSLTDRFGNASEMVYIPCFLLSDVIEGAEQIPHPAFVVDGRVLPGIYISKYQNVIVDGCACSKKGVDPAVNVTLDEALLAAERKGEGWHLMTAAEWGAIALLSMRDGFLPYGNNDLGRDIRESEYTATVSYRDDEKGIVRTATGSGPVTWNHNGKEDGICDLNGNVWEWNAGMRLVYGEVQLLGNHSGKDAARVSAADSPEWRAIDARTGDCILPSGDGRTPYSVKLDYVDGIWTYRSGDISDSYPHARFCDFSAVRAADDVSERARLLLKSLGCLPTGDLSLVEGVALYANNGKAERIPFRGGRWGQGLNAGVFKTCLDDPRGYAGEAVGFRTSYYAV